MKRKFHSIIGLLVFAYPLVIVAQVLNADLAMKIATVRKQNAALMKQYTWNCRTELTDQGKVADIRIELVNYGPDGQLQRTLLNDQPASLPRGFLRHAVAENKKKQTEEYMKGLRDLLDQYTLATAGKILDFVSQASTTPIQTSDGHVQIQMNGSSVVMPGDTFSLSMDPLTNQARQINITCTYEGSLITASATFKTNKAGLNCLTFGEVDVPDKELVLQVQNFDYELANN